MTAPRLALCLEQTLGHRAHTLNLAREAGARGPRVDLLRVEYQDDARLPLPWAVEGSLQAIRRLRRLAHRPDVAFFHTSTVSLFAPRTGVPYVVSVDATPLQLDAMGEFYRHRRMAPPLEAAKRGWYRRVFRGAAAMVAWSEWAARSLVDDYGVDPDRIVVAHPGAGPDFFAIERPRRDRADLPVILFVGGDFERKGGPDLLAAHERLRGRAQLLMVTGAPLAARPGVEVSAGISPGTPALIAAYARADIFCLPTRGDCTSVAIEEAMAAGLPVITTRVGSNPDTVRHGEEGILVEAGDVLALDDALERLVDDAALRLAMGRAAREAARERYDAGANARRVLDAVEAAA
jgi:glycosyltransferase involved in cell wall biosynthesis